MEKWGAKDMELILGLLCERRKIRVEWKQIACAVILAIVCAGIYSYIDIHTGHVKEKIEKRYTALEDYTPALDFYIEMPLLPERNMKKSKEQVLPDVVAEQIDAAANMDKYSGLEDTRDTENKKKVDNKINKIKQTLKESPDNFIPDVITEIPGVSIKNPGIAAEIPGDIIKNPDAVTDQNEAVGGAEGEEKKDTDKAESNLPVISERFPGFLANDKGYITGYTDASKFMKDHLVVLPVHGACTGIEKNALKGLEKEVYEIYIPANIIYIAEGAFDDLRNLCYIEASAGNRQFYSKNGILYYRDGRVAACPERIKK